MTGDPVCAGWLWSLVACGRGQASRVFSQNALGSVGKEISHQEAIHERARGRDCRTSTNAGVRKGWEKSIVAGTECMREAWRPSSGSRGRSSEDP